MCACMASSSERIPGIFLSSQGNGTGKGGNCGRNRLWIFGIVADEVFVVLFHFFREKTA